MPARGRTRLVLRVAKRVATHPGLAQLGSAMSSFTSGRKWPTA